MQGNASWIETRHRARNQENTMLIHRIALTFTTLALVSGASHAGTPETDRVRAEIQRNFGFVPRFIDAIPDVALPSAWDEMATFQMNPHTALSNKTKELIGLAVASQIPCRYCIYAHSAFARLGGASDAELGEAVAVAAQARHWSTFMNGIMLDEQSFRAEIDKAVDYLQHPPAAAMTAAKPTATEPAKLALMEASQAFGLVPEFLKRFPASGVAAAWHGMRDIEVAETKIAGKDKSLISLAVAAQIPCRYCIVADTAFARLQGATDQEIAEAVGMASVVRLWSTLLNGTQVDEPAFRQDVDRLVKNARKAASAHH